MAYMAMETTCDEKGKQCEWEIFFRERKFKNKSYSDKNVLEPHRLL